MKQRFTVVLLAIVSLFNAGAELIPAERLTDWEPGVDVGIIGGIDQYLPGGASERTVLVDVTQEPYNADPTGVESSQDAIYYAIQAVSLLNNGSVVYIPAGTYRVVGGYVNGSGVNNRSNFTIRGAGSDQTFINFENPTPQVGAFIDFGTGSSWTEPATDNAVLSGLTAGSTSIVVEDGANFAAGYLMRIQFQNEQDNTEIEGGENPVLYVNGERDVRKHLVRVTSVVGDTINFTPPLTYAPRAGLTAKVFRSIFPTHSVGIEGMTVNSDGSEPYALIRFQDVYNCWIKDVKVVSAYNYGIILTNNINCEIRESWISEIGAGGSNGGGLLTDNTVRLLVEDNIINLAGPCMELNYNTTGCAFLHNYVDGVVNINHAPHNSFNLHEGNHYRSVQSDGYFGGEEKTTFHRNWISGVGAAGQVFTFSAKRFCRELSLVGNLFGNTDSPYSDSPYADFGQPNIGNPSSTGTSEMSAGDFPVDWLATATLTTRSSATAGTITLSGSAVNTTGRFRSYIIDGDTRWEMTNVVASTPQVFTFTIDGTLPAQGTVMEYWAGTEGFQELDQDVLGTSVRRINRILQPGNAGIPSGEELGGDTHEDSLAYEAEPTWWPDDRDWPPYSYTMTTDPDGAIPAERRFLGLDDAVTGKRGRVGGKTIRIGKVIVIGNN